jgi:hypothetical protein
MSLHGHFQFLIIYQNQIYSTNLHLQTNFCTLQLRCNYTMCISCQKKNYTMCIILSLVERSNTKGAPLVRTKIKLSSLNLDYSMLHYLDFLRYG